MKSRKEVFEHALAGLRSLGVEEIPCGEIVFKDEQSKEDLVGFLETSNGGLVHVCRHNSSLNIMKKLQEKLCTDGKFSGAAIDIDNNHGN